MILHLQVREAAERKTWITRFRGVGKAPEAGKRAYQILRTSAVQACHRIPRVRAMPSRAC